MDYTLNRTYCCLAKPSVSFMQNGAFLQNAISFALLYIAIYIYKNSAVYLSDARVTFFCIVHELRNPFIMVKKGNNWRSNI